MGREKKSMSRNLNNKSLKTEGEKMSREPTQGFLKREGKRGKEQEQRSEEQVSEDRRGDREWRTYIGISRKRYEWKTGKEQNQRSV